MNAWNAERKATYERIREMRNSQRSHYKKTKEVRNRNNEIAGILRQRSTNWANEQREMGAYNMIQERMDYESMATSALY